MNREKIILDNIFAASLEGDRKYLALPNILEPRLVAPLYNWRVFAAGLNIQNTASIYNRIIKNIILFLYPVFKLLSHQIVTITSKFIEIIKTALELLEFEYFSELSFYIGTPGSINRKITILLLDEYANSLGIIKYPINEYSSEFIKSEYKTLVKLCQYTFLYLITPKKNKTVSVEGKELLFQENIFIGVSQLDNRLNSVIVAASFELSNFTKSTEVSHYLNDLLKGAFELPLDENLITRIKETTQILITKNIPTVIIHGDYVLYNMKKKESKLALIDWEFSRLGLPLFDLFHFVFQGNYQIEKMNVKNCLKEIFMKKNVEFFKNYLKKLSIDEEVINSLFMIYLIDALLFDIKVKRETNFEDNHFYKALKLL